MPKPLTHLPVWQPASLLSFFAGMLVYGLASGVLTESVDEQVTRVQLEAYSQGYADAESVGPAIEVQETAIHIISSAIFLDSMEVELKGISRRTNAIEFSYGEKGGKRYLVGALNVGDGIAHSMSNNLYTIKNVSVSANLQRATVEVTRITLPPKL